MHLARVGGLLLLAVFCLRAGAEPVVLHLKNGDRVSGNFLSESTNGVVLATSWNPNLLVPLGVIERREVTPPVVAVTNVAPSVVAVTTNATPSGKDVVAAAAEKPKPVAPSRWKSDAKFGADVIRGAKDRNIYYGTFALTYAQPYERNPKKFFRNRFDYRVDYGTTEGVESANRMFGSNKTDFDLGERSFIYNFMSTGYDEVRKIDHQYEIGPGAGYRLVQKPTFALNVEGGLNYQLQDRADGEIEALQYRLGEDFTWKMHPRVTFSQRTVLLARVDAPDEVQLRAEANLAFGLIQNLTFNLTAIELYDTRPVPGVTPNEFQFRSSLGLTF